MSSFPSDVRDDVLAAFDKDNAYYHHVRFDEGEPYRYDAGFIDTLSWVARCWGACLLVGDTELAGLCERCVKTVLTVGPDARSFAPTKLDEDWVESKTLPGMWYVAKENYFDGPGALQWAVSLGAPVENLLKVQVMPGVRVSVKTAARFQVALGGLYGWWYKRTHSWSPPILGDRQVEPVWLSYLVLQKRVPESMLWMTEENPWYSYIAGKKCNVSYPLTRRFVNGVTKTSGEVTSFQKTKPNAWVFKRDPFSEYTDGGSGEVEKVSYTPVWKLVADYCQSALR